LFCHGGDFSTAADRHSSRRSGRGQWRVVGGERRGFGGAQAVVMASP
jgi:hypothetical protein